jgi:hypothetical protein
LASNGAGCLGSCGQGGHTDVIGIGKGGLFTAHGAHPHTLIDTEAPGLDDALLQTPALAAAVLEVQVGEIDAMGEHIAKHTV